LRLRLRFSGFEVLNKLWLYLLNSCIRGKDEVEVKAEAEVKVKVEVEVEVEVKAEVKVEVEVKGRIQDKGTRRRGDKGNEK
jgi:hypothetical protein